MSTRDLIDAINTGNSTEFQKHFEEQLAMRIAARLDERRQEVAQSLFGEERIKGVKVEGDKAIVHIPNHQKYNEVNEIDAAKTKLPPAAPGKKWVFGMHRMKSNRHYVEFHHIDKDVRHWTEEKDLDEAMAGANSAADKPVHPNALHVQHVGGGKYKVHAVGKNWSDGIKTGEHLSDSELDDFAEMGGKIKHMK